MTALIFLLMAVAMMAASAGHRGTAIGLFGVSFVRRRSSSPSRRSPVLPL